MHKEIGPTQSEICPFVVMTIDSVTLSHSDHNDALGLVGFNDSNGLLFDIGDKEAQPNR
ncbi:MAG: hypothetical protein NVS4B8_20120 [Herpetosiphon sp.]